MAATEIEPYNLIFTLEEEPNYFDPAPAALIAINENFATTSQLTFETDSTLSSYSVASNQMTITHPAGDTNIFGIETDSFLTVPQFWAEIQIDQLGTGNGTWDWVGVGIAKDHINFVMMFIDKVINTCCAFLCVAGSYYTYILTAYTAVAGDKIALSMCGSVCSIWKNIGSGWVYINSVDVYAHLDFWTSATIAGFKFAFGSGCDSTSQWKLSNFKCGSFGGVGIRDMTIVTEEDGSPHIVDDVVQFTATALTPTGQGNCGVFNLNLTTYEIEQVGVIWIDRDGWLAPDVAAHIIWYSNGDRRLTITTWGNGFGGEIYLLHKLITTGDILTGVSLVSDMFWLDVAGISVNFGSYDPMLAWDGSKWLIAYSITENTNFSPVAFYPALASSPDLTEGSFTLIGSGIADKSEGWEGTKLAKINGFYWYLCGGVVGDGQYAIVFDDEFVYRGDITATLVGGTYAIPHPMIFPYGDKVVLLTFDSTKFNSLDWTWGQPKIHLATRYSAVLTGTALSAITETDIVTGGKTIIITLSNDTWIPASP